MLLNLEITFAGSPKKDISHELVVSAILRNVAPFPTHETHSLAKLWLIGELLNE